jgi:sugar lactone lactonase YvrE
MVLRGTKLDIADAGNNRVREVDVLSGKITTLVGTGIAGFGGDGGFAKAARLSFPLGLALEPTGSLLIADSGNARVRRVNIAGIVSTVAGNGAPDYAGDGGTATDASLNFPTSVAADASGAVLVADQGNRRVRSVGVAGVITTVAGNGTLGWGGDGGGASTAELNQPTAVATTADGRVLIADGWNHMVRAVLPSGELQAIAGQPGINGSSGDGGPATNATLGFVTGVVADHAGNIFVADWNNRVRKIATDGTITTVAGTDAAGYGGDGGRASNALLSQPSGLAIDSHGNLLIADTGNNRVRRVAAVKGVIGTSSTITTIAGNGTAGFSGDGGQATKAMLDEPMGVALDASGNVIVADTDNQRVRRISPKGVITTLAGTGQTGFSPDGTTATRSALNHPRSAIVDSSGALVLTDTGNCVVRRVTSPGTSTATIKTVAGWPPVKGTTPVCAYGQGTSPMTGGTVLNNPSGLALGASGQLYLADSLNHRIRAITLG